jgi:uncharacterized DUF497 family protein
MMVFDWNEWNEDHVGGHGVSRTEAEYLIEHARPPYPEPIGNDKWRVRGQTAEGRYLQVIFLFDADGTVFVIHARGLNESEKRGLRRRRR